MKSFLQFLSEGEGHWTQVMNLDDVLELTRGTKLVDPSGNPLKLYRGIRGPYSPDHPIASSGYLGPGVYTSPDINVASGYLPRETAVVKPKNWWNPFSKPITREIQSPAGVLIRGLANVKNPLYLSPGETPERKLGLRHSYTRPIDSLEVKDAIKKRGIDAIVGADKTTSGRPIPIVNITDPDRFYPVGEWSPVTQPSLRTPSGARRGAISADMLTTMGKVGSAIGVGAVVGAGAALDAVAGVLTTPPNKTRQQMEKMMGSDAGLAFNITPEGELEADPAGMKAVRTRQKQGISFPTYYPQDIYK